MSYENNVRKVTPYTPGEQPSGENIIKLNTNENPYPPSPRVKEALLNFDPEKLKLYPDPAISSLKKALSERYDVPVESVFCGVGSDDVLAMSFMTFFNGEKPVLFPDITYSFYDVWAEVFRIPYKTMPLREDFTIDPSDYMKENGGIVIPNPNAPTGVTEGVKLYEDIIKANPDSVVIIDEAYVDFGAETVLPLINEYDNLLVVRTFSKSASMAGSRIGYAFGNPKLIKYLEDVKYSFNSYTIDRITEITAVAELSDPEWMEKNIKKVIETRERSKTELKKLGFTFGDSLANFVFVKHSDVSAKKIYEELKSRGIYVRYFNKPRIDDYLRITIGTDEEMEKLFVALASLLAK
ncbi:MAG: histidinol-phosphate transaminase [Lachnospiraceae bacterium]|nr:histidinol-phosphate transaminase [Lachnospiraceae bacterium]